MIMNMVQWMVYGQQEIPLKINYQFIIKLKGL